MPLRIEIHALQNFVPSNLNRDDTGAPKDAFFGGYRRARISSQCAKRAIREFFKTQQLFPKNQLATRTNQLLDMLRVRLADRGRPEEAIPVAVAKTLAAGKMALSSKKDREEDTEYLIFLGANEIDALAELIDTHFDELVPKALLTQASDKTDAPTKKLTAAQKKAEAKKAAPKAIVDQLPKLLDGGKAADLALFGRMLADLPSRNVDAACQVAHAISTNHLKSMEMDYFTAVDDEKERRRKIGENVDAGAGMIESTGFNSACYYRYANLDLGQLTANLQGDKELVQTTVRAFLTAFVHAVPTGKQNSFAAHQPPSFVLITVRTGGPVSLANAFVKPINPTKGNDLITDSIAAIDQHYGDLTAMYGDGGLKTAMVVALGETQKKLQNLKSFQSTSVQDAIEQAVASAFAQEATA